MFSVLESFRSALQSIYAHRFRSFLTSLGIIIGVASVIAVVSIVQGLSASISNEFKGLGSNSLTVEAYTTFEEALQGKENVLGIGDYERIVTHIDDISNVSPAFAPFGNFGTTVRAGATSTFTQVMAVTETYMESAQVFPAKGRFLRASDDQSRRRVAVVGSKTLENLRLTGEPLGQFIDIGGEWFKIIGVTEEKGETFGISKDNYILIPFAVGQVIAGTGTKLNISISFTVNDIEQIDAVQGRVTSLLRQSHHLKPGQRNDFKVQTAQQLSESFESIIATLTLVLGGIVSISLLVGGIGIMNIMLVSVTERTREIGICKALGAQRHHILMQFLIEATTLSLLGGLVGLLLGYLIGFGAAKAIPNFPDAFVPWWAIAMAFGFSSLVGIVFGIMPAAKAANLHPIDALRYE
ncbi:MULTISPECIES: ABC transporter permease [unclassified Massilia]|uniref:ABC transporter permease n=1 Tax=unclassified Massilia TaxID=2609279 RepID=UPI001B818E39|nr:MULTISPECIES: ABC transporter permease [unclassified Massilia]MBQ5940989.1 ABC transporter permease [Massilia sp. AB1]MBQ5963779.1 ABC transporter permease [Massilia sp. ZL223]